MVDDPIARFQRLFTRVVRAGVPLPEAVALATVDGRGRPSVRFVLLKQADARGFVFFTNGRSRKGRELDRNPHAALACYWHALGKQVRVEGAVEPVSDAEADDYWATRPRASQLAALASRQSAPVTSRALLLARWRALRQQHAGRAVPRPRHWVGFRLRPQLIEFWTHRDHRLHDRELYRRRGTAWRRVRLQP